MNALLLKPQAKQLFEVQPQNSHPKLSLSRVFYVKILRWIDKASPEALRKAVVRSTTFLLILSGVFLPSHTLGILTSAAQWNGFRIPIASAIFFSVLNARRIWTYLRRITVRRRGSNAHTYHGIPVGEFAAWLMEQKAFKRDEAIKKWALSQGQYHKIAAELDKHGLMTRGENNARVLRDIPMEDLVRQLRDDFPLAWSEERQMFYEKNGTLERWAINQDFQRRKLAEETERKERKLERLQKKIEDTSQFAHTLSLCQ